MYVTALPAVIYVSSLGGVLVNEHVRILDTARPGNEHNVTTGPPPQLSASLPLSLSLSPSLSVSLSLPHPPAAAS